MNNFKILTLKHLEEIHLLTSTYIEAQTKVTLTTYIVFGTLLFFCSIVTIRSMFLKYKFHLLIMQIILLIGYTFGLTGGYCLQQFYVIGSQKGFIFDKVEQERLKHVYYGFVYSFGFFSIAINVSHWIFAMQYWSLTVRLESAIKQFDSFKTEVKVKTIFFSGLLINLSTGALIIVAYYEISSRKFESWVEAINVAPAFISVFFLVDAMRRLRTIVKSKFVVDTW